MQLAAITDLLCCIDVAVLPKESSEYGGDLDSTIQNNSWISFNI